MQKEIKFFHGIGQVGVYAQNCLVVESDWVEAVCADALGDAVYCFLCVLVVLDYE